MPLQRRKSARMVRRSQSVAVPVTSSSSENTSPDSGDHGGSSDASMGKKWMSLMTTRHGRSVQEMIDQWLDMYRVDSCIAFSKLLQYFFHFSGYSIDINSARFMQSDKQQVFRFLDQPRQENRFSYPLKMAGKHKEVIQFEYFVDIFVKQTHDTLTDNDLYLNHWIVWLKECANSPMRSVRHTATFACLKWNAALNGILRNYLQSKRLLECNRKSSMASPLQPRTSNQQQSSGPSGPSIDRQLSNLDKRIKVTHNMCRTFDQVLQDRMNDVDALIRMLCLREFKFYVKNFPEIYVDEHYFNLIAMFRFDCNPKLMGVFLEVVEMMLTLKDHKDAVNIFVMEIVDDLLTLSQTADKKICLVAIKLLTCIYQSSPELLSEQHTSLLCSGIFALDLEIARETSLFFMSYLKKDLDRLQLKLSTSSGKQVSRNVSILYNLIQFYHQTCFDRKCKFLANALIHAHPIFIDWQAYVDLLNEVVFEFELQLQDEIALADLMVHFVKRCTKPPKDNKNKLISRLNLSEKRFQKENMEKLSVFFINHLTSLLQKYRGCDDVLCKLVKVAQYCSVTTLTQFQTEVEQLLGEINHIIEVSLDKKMLTNCFKVYAKFFTIDGLMRSTCYTIFDCMVDKLCTYFAQNWHLSPQLSIIQVSATKLLSCCVHHDLTSFNLWENIFGKLLTNEHYFIKDYDFCETLISGCRCYLLWQMKFYMDVPEHDLADVKRRIFELFDFSRLLMLPENPFKLRCLGFLNASDMLVLFSHQITRIPSCVRQLHYAPDQVTLTRMCSFMDEDLVTEIEAVLPEADEAEKFVELKRILFAFSKLILFHIFTYETSIHVLQHHSLIKYLNLDDLLDKLFTSILDKNEWGNHFANVFLQLSLRSDFAHVSDLCKYLISKLKIKKRRVFELGESTEVIKMIFQIIIFFNRELRQDAHSPFAHIISVLPDFVSKLQTEHLNYLIIFLKENKANILAYPPHDQHLKSELDAFVNSFN